MADEYDSHSVWFRKVDAVGKTSVTLPVKERIALGLSRAGTSNTLKVVSYNTILGVIAVFSVGAIRQFCAFAIVVLVAHWFLAHTFFLAVLSIDIQRLEVCIDYPKTVSCCLSCLSSKNFCDRMLVYRLQSRLCLAISLRQTLSLDGGSW
jgi:hypothetical protein